MATINELKIKLPHTMTNPATLVQGTKLIADRLAAVAHQFFLAYIHGKRKARSKDGINRLPGDWFTVDSRILKSVGSSNYYQYVALLVSNGIVEPRLNAEGHASYLPGHRGKQYRFVPSLDTVSDVVFRDFTITDKRTIKSILKTRDAYRETYGNRAACAINIGLPETTLKFLGESLQKVEVDHEKARLIISTLPNDVQDIHLYSIDNINQHFHFDTFGHRLHSSITNLKKELRQAIKFAEEGQLCIIDIKNSQPYFAAIMPKAASMLLFKEYGIIRPYIQDQVEASFFENCRKGNIYDGFGKSLGISREEAKEAFFRGVMFRNRVVTEKNAKLLAAAFKKEYPLAHKLFTRLRNLTNTEVEPIRASLFDHQMKSAHKFRRHKLLPLIMQRMESAMVYRYIIPAFMAAGIGPVLTIHDSFIIPARHYALAVQVITQSFTAIGVGPPIMTVELLGEVDIQ